MAKVVWESKITSEMVEGWSEDLKDELIAELDDAVQRVFEDLEFEFLERFNIEDGEPEE